MPRNSSSSVSSSQRRRTGGKRASLSGRQRSGSRNDREFSGREFPAAAMEDRPSLAARGGGSAPGRGSQRRQAEDNRPEHDDRGYSGAGGQYREDDYRQSQANRGFSGEFQGAADRRDYDDYNRPFPGRGREEDYAQRSRAEGRSWSGADEHRGSGRSQPGDPRYAGDDFSDRRGYQSHSEEYARGYNDGYYHASARSQRDYEEEARPERGQVAPRGYYEGKGRPAGRGRRNSSR